MPAEVLIAAASARLVPYLESALQPLPAPSLVLDPERPQALWEALELHQPQVLLLEFDRAGIDCPRTLQQILVRHPALHVIVLSLKTSREEVRAALTAGASGYCCLADGFEDLAGMIGAVRSGSVRLSPTALRALLLPQSASTPESEAGPALTAREHEVARLITNGHSSREIAALLHISMRTVDSHRASIRKKLRGRSHADPVGFDRGDSPEG